MTPHVRAKIRIRNQLRRTINTNRQEWINACREANEAINEAKTDSWKEVLEGVMTSTNNRDMWKVIKGLNGTPEANSPNEAMSHHGRVITDAKAKANIFVNHYVRVSNLPMSAADRQLNRKLKKRLDAPSTDDESCSKFTMRELTSAINKMKRKGAAGPDNIPPTLMKALGPIALQELLAIFNESFRHADCPRIWRVAVIIPILKAGKPEIASYRPISLTSCVVKLLERMLADRLYYISETQNLFSPFQAGFRRGRSCEDQILRIVQASEDGFQKKPKHRSVLVLLDFSKAYDTFWREKLLLRMLDTGIPITIIRWLRSFLNNRRARVQLFNVLSNSRRFKQGLPQGSVLSPLLFLFYINDLTDELSDEDVIALFADDVSILSTARNKADAERSVQAKVDIVSGWSQQWKLKLNVGKSEVSAFSAWSNDSKWEPTISLQGRNIPFNSTPRLLGVLLDRSFTCNTHIDKLHADTASRLRGMKLVSHSTWGWKKSTVKTMYFAYVRSKMDYAAPAWQPWLSNTNMTRLEALQNRALRIVTGQLVSTPLDALRKKANVNSYSTTSKQLILKAREKALRNTDDHPKRMALNAHVPQRLQSRSNWRRKAIELAMALPEALNHRQQTDHFTIRPWIVDDSNNFIIHQSITGISSRADISR